jgi:hypothetical protein
VEVITGTDWPAIWTGIAKFNSAGCTAVLAVGNGHERTRAMLTIGTCFGHNISGIMVAAGIPAGCRWHFRSGRRLALLWSAERFAYASSTL